MLKLTANHLEETSLMFISRTGRRAMAALAVTPLLLAGCGSQTQAAPTSAQARTDLVAALGALDDQPTLATTVAVDVPASVWNHLRKDSPQVPESVWKFGQDVNLRVVSASADGKALQGQWATPGAVNTDVSVNNGSHQVVDAAAVNKTLYLTVSLDELSAIVGHDVRPQLEAAAGGPAGGMPFAPLVQALLAGKAISVKTSTFTAIAKQLGGAAGLPAQDPQATGRLYAALRPALEQATDVTESGDGHTFQVTVNVREAVTAVLQAARGVVPGEMGTQLPTAAQVDKEIPADKTVTATVAVEDGVAHSVTFDLAQLASMVDRAKLALAGQKMLLTVDFDTHATAPTAPTGAVPADALLTSLTRSMSEFAAGSGAVRYGVPQH